MTPSSDGAAPGSILDPRLRGATVGLLALVTLIAFEALAVATAMPVAADELGGVRWYGLAFSLFLTASLFGTVAAGGWADRVGPRAPTLVGMVVFAAGLALAGTASSFTALLAGRAVSGLGAGLQSVVIYLVVAAVYPMDLQPRMFSAVSAAWVVPGMVGPSIAGLLTDAISWRAVFLVVLPPLLVLVPLLWPHLHRGPEPPDGEPPDGEPPDGEPPDGEPRDGEPRDGEHPDGEHPDGEPVAPRQGGGDAVRMVRGGMLALGASLLQAGLVTLGTSLGRVLTGVGALATFGALPGLLPAGVARVRRGLPALVLSRSLFTATFFGAEAFLPLMLVSHRGLSPAQAGLALTTGTIGWSAGAWWQGHGKRHPDHGRLAWIGGLLLGLSVPVVAVGAIPGVPPLSVVPIWLVTGLGMGLAMSSTSVLLIRLSQPAEQGRNAAALQIGDSLGGVLGIGAASAVFAALHDPGAGDGDVYTLIWVGLGVTGMLSALTAARIMSERVRRGLPQGQDQRSDQPRPGG